MTSRLVELYACAFVPLYRRSHMAEPELVTPGVIEGVKRDLWRCPDASLLETTGRLITAQTGERENEFGKWLLARAATLDPDGRLRRQASPPPDAPFRIRFGSFEGPQVRYRDRAVCPADVVCQGIVRVGILVGRDGKVVRVTPVSGPPTLYRAAKESGLRWVFTPGRVDGELAEFYVPIDMRFEPH